MKGAILMREPTVLAITGDPHPTGLLLSALADYVGEPVEVFVRTHADTGETIVAMVPTQGPSLARALRDWADAWWEDDDTARWGSIPAYLAGFGVAVPEDELASFSPSCPYCGADDLFVQQAVVRATGMAVTAYGFSSLDADTLDTEDEQVACNTCGRTFPLDRVTL